MKVKLISHTKNPEHTVAWAAKTCYSSVDIFDIDPGYNTEEFITRLLSFNHLSPFEHANFTFAIKGVSRACTHQLVRHRLASYSQRSQRYVKESFPGSMIPETIVNSRYHIKFLETLDVVYDFYNELVDAKIPEEDARYILPNACMSQLIMSMNARELIHFCQVRMCNRAQKEIQDLATEIAGILISKFPLLFSGQLLPLCLIEGECPEGEISCGTPLPERIKELQ